jgi:hypothetical protein
VLGTGSLGKQRGAKKLVGFSLEEGRIHCDSPLEEDEAGRSLDAGD